MKKMNKKGFSLIELIVVIAIMAVLVGVLTPALLSYVERSRAQKDDSAMGEVVNAITLALADQGIYDEMLMCSKSGKTTIRFENGGQKFVLGSATIEEESDAEVAADTALSAVTRSGEYATEAATAGALATRLNNIIGTEVKLTSRTHRQQEFLVEIDFGTTDYTVKVTRGNSGAGWCEAD